MLRFSDAKIVGPVQNDIADTNAKSSHVGDKPIFCEASGNQRASELYHATTEYLAESFEGVKEGQSFDIERGFGIVSDIVDSTVTRDEWYEAINQISYPIQPDAFLVLHHANVAIYSICLSITLRFTRDEQRAVGLAALLHDIGKVCLSGDILCKEGQLTNVEREELRQYPYKSFEILSTFGKKIDVQAQCALMVNERIDGSGFPRGLAGDLIHCYAQMIGLVDVYEAMTSSRPYRQKWLHYDAIREILRKRKRAFHQSYIRALLKTFSVFRLNTYVRLNSGVIGKIIEVREELPLRPKIQVMYDSESLKLAVPYVVDLSTQPVLHIAAPVAESDLNSI